MKRKSNVDPELSTNKFFKSEYILHYDTVKEALDYLHRTFPENKFQKFVRPLILKSQLYGLCNNRTRVDHELNDLRNANTVRLIKLGGDTDDTVGIMKTEDFREVLLDYATHCDISLDVLEKFIAYVLEECESLSIQKCRVTGKFCPEDIKKLVHLGGLTIRDSGSWWVSTPIAGYIMKAYTKGNARVKMMLKRSKFKELLLSTLLTRTLGKEASLGIMYHVYDLLGCGYLKKISTTSGPLLRIS